MRKTLYPLFYQLTRSVLVVLVELQIVVHVDFDEVLGLLGDRLVGGGESERRVLRFGDYAVRVGHVLVFVADGAQRIVHRSRWLGGVRKQVIAFEVADRFDDRF